MHTFYSGYGSCSVPPSQHFHILQSISHLSVDRNENEKMWVLLIKIVVTKYPRDKWYQFNAGNILRIQPREGKTITNICLMSFCQQTSTWTTPSIELQRVVSRQAVSAVSQCRRRPREARLYWCFPLAADKLRGTSELLENFWQPDKKGNLKSF